MWQYFQLHQRPFYFDSERPFGRLFTLERCLAAPGSLLPFWYYGTFSSAELNRQLVGESLGNPLVDEVDLVGKVDQDRPVGLYLSFDFS